MEAFIQFIEPIGFIGDDSGDGPPPGFVAWDTGVPWDEITYWS